MRAQALGTPVTFIFSSSPQPQLKIKAYRLGFAINLEKRNALSSVMSHPEVGKEGENNQGGSHLLHNGNEALDPPGPLVMSLGLPPLTVISLTKSLTLRLFSAI